jgi:hypothetical protein
VGDCQDTLQSSAGGDTLEPINCEWWLSEIHTGSTCYMIDGDLQRNGGKQFKARIVLYLYIKASQMFFVIFNQFLTYSHVTVSIGLQFGD